MRHFRSDILRVFADPKEDPFIGQGVLRSLEEWESPVGPDDSMGATSDFYERTRLKKILFIIACIIVTIVVAAYAIAYGAVNISYLDTYTTIWHHLTGDIINEQADYVIFQLRMPRILCAIFAGAGLAVSGAVLQSTLRNPMADSYTTGVSSGASFGATLVMAGTGGLFITGNLIVMGAFVFSLVPIGIMVLMSKIKDASPTTMIMVGIGVMYIFNALTTLLMMRTDPQALANIYHWQVGTLGMIKWPSIPILVVVTVVGIALMMIISGRLNVLATGDETAKALGIDADNLRILCLLIVGIVTAVIVSFTGLIGFVGLVAPHIVRLFIGSDNRYLIPASAALGSMLLVVADLIGRMILRPTVIQVGVVMALIGAPLFLWLLMRKNSSAW